MEIEKTLAKLSTDEYCKVVVKDKTEDLDSFSVHQFISDGKRTLVIIDETSMKASIWQIARNHFSPTGFTVTERHSVPVRRCSGISDVSKPQL
ncbi:MAG TPA: hypothetical protein VLE44_00900 [Candidatus Saccharimonadales bacterium]|nr:hypothetical protein [Candidatus Saccharimonadales bacterium]